MENLKHLFSKAHFFNSLKFDHKKWLLNSDSSLNAAFINLTAINRNMEISYVYLSYCQRAAAYLIWINLPWLT